MSDKCFVLDTNILVSGIIFELGKPARVIDLARELGTIYLSPETKAELITVFERDKFDRYLSLEQRSELLASFLESVDDVDVSQRVRLSRDPDDDKFLELAVEVDAECIVSGDKDLLVLESIQGIPIMNAATFQKRSSP